MRILQVFFIMALIVVFFGFVFYIIYYIFFKKHRRDLPFENWKKYKESALANGSDMMDDLVLTGDRNHSTKVFMKIQGYLRFRSFDGREFDMFVGKRSPNNPFEEHKIVMVEPKEHTDLIGDVMVYGISLINKYGYYFLNSSLLDYGAIDKTVTFDTYRSLTYETLGDLKGLIDRATGLDAEYRKEVQQQKLLKIPLLTGQQPPPNQGSNGMTGSP